MIVVEAKIKEEGTNIPRFWPQARRWAVKGGWALLDQGLFSGANFLVNVLLARWLAPEEYGAFAVALSIYYLLMGFHTAVLTEPMMVFGAGKYRKQFREYLGMLLWGHWGISALIVQGLAGAAWFFLRRGLPLGEALLALAVASPFLLLLWLTRRACYANLKPALAVVGSAINLVVVLAGLFLLWKAGLLSSLTVMVLLGVAAGMASLALTALYLSPRVWGFSAHTRPMMVFGEHWRYGSWNFISSLAYWASGNIFTALVSAFLGFSVAGAMAAIWNLYRPLGLFMQSLGLLLMPTFSKWFNAGMPLKRRAVLLGGLFGSVAFLYAIFLYIGAEDVLHMIYGDKYDEYKVLVGLFGLVIVASTISGIFNMTLKVMGCVRRVAMIWGFSSIFVLTIGVFIILVSGIQGAVIAYAGSYMLAAILAFVNLNNETKMK